MLYLLLLEAALPLVGSSGAGLGQPFLHSRALRGCEVNIALLFLLRGSLLWMKSDENQGPCHPQDNLTPVERGPLWCGLSNDFKPPPFWTWHHIFLKDGDTKHVQVVTFLGTRRINRWLCPEAFTGKPIFFQSSHQICFQFFSTKIQNITLFMNFIKSLKGKMSPRWTLHVKMFVLPLKASPCHHLSRSHGIHSGYNSKYLLLKEFSRRLPTKEINAFEKQLSLTAEFAF